MLGSLMTALLPLMRGRARPTFRPGSRRVHQVLRSKRRAKWHGLMCPRALSSARQSFGCHPLPTNGRRHEAYAVVVAVSIVVMEPPRRFRTNKRARCTRDFTLGTLSRRASAISRVDRPSTSRSTSTVR